MMARGARRSRIGSAAISAAMRAMASWRWAAAAGYEPASIQSDSFGIYRVGRLVRA